MQAPAGSILRAGASVYPEGLSSRHCRLSLADGRINLLASCHARSFCSVSRFCSRNPISRGLKFSGFDVSVRRPSPVGGLKRGFEMGLLSNHTVWAVTFGKMSVFACFYSKWNCFLIACGQHQLDGWRAFTGLQYPRTATIYDSVIGPA